MGNTRKMVMIGFFIAIEIILTRFLSIQTPIIRFGFGFIPLSFSAMLFGPVAGAITGAVADIIGMMLFPKGAYFPGFTVSAALSGAIYGMYFYKRPKNLVNIFLAVVTITLFVDLGLNTIWLSILTKKAVYAIMTPRLIKNLVTIPIKIMLIHIMWKTVGIHLDKSYGKISV